MRKLIPAYILSFVISFMLFIVEPVTMFVNNRNDFQFNFNNILKPVIVISIVSFVVLSLIYTIIFYINKKISKKMRFFNVIMIISYILFILFYIQGNYMVGNLPALDGSNLSFSTYLKENIITIVILIILITSYVFLVKKYGYEKVINKSTYIILAVFFMLFSGLLPSLFDKRLYDNKKVSLVSNYNINNISENKNFFVLVLDAVDSRSFARELEKSEYKDVLKDFTYYPDTLSMYIFTRDSIPYILSGKANYNETDFPEYSNKAMDESPLIDRLLKEKYQINLYENDLIWNTEKTDVVQNIGSFDKSFSNYCYLKQQVKYDMFKYLPFFLKSFSRVESFDLNYCKIEGISDAFSFYDKDLYDLINNKSLKKIKDNNFNFIHVEGAHVPFNLDGDLNKISNGTYAMKVEATVSIVNSYLKRIRESGEYDNSIIIIMADHGYADGGIGTRANPILYIKGFDEHHDMKVSDKAISYADLMDAYNDLLDGKKSTELFSKISSERERKYIWYLYLEEDHKVEIATKGKAWEYKKEYKTGKEYNR